MGDKSNKILCHRPFGRHHPYEQEPEERFPREPIAGEPVKLGVKINPGSAIESVWAVWRIAGSTVDHRVAGVLAQKASEFDLWQIELAPFESGSRISYSIFAKGTNVQEQSEWFSFDVATWVNFDQLVAASEDAEKIHIVLSSKQAASFIELDVCQQTSGTLSMAMHQSKNIAAVSKVDEKLNAKLGALSVEVNARPCTLSISKEGAFALKTGGIQALMDVDGTILRYSFAVRSPKEEAFYGFGERYNSLDQRGNTLVNRVIDQYKNQDRRTYYAVPFFISSLGYGLWVKTDREVIFDMAESDAAVWKIESDAGDTNSDLAFDLMPQGEPNNILQEFTRLTGRSKMPPSWVFGLWMSSNDWNSQAEVEKQYALTQKHKIASTVLVIEAWSDEANFYIWNDAQYKLKAGGEAFKYSDFTFPKEGRWTDPKGMTDKLHAGGTRLILWQNPTLKHCMPEENLDERQNKLDEQYWLENNLGVMEADGTAYRVRSPWFKEGLVADFTNPKTIDWWFKQREYLVTEVGVDGFKTDGGEHLWTRTARFADGTSAKGRSNSFPYLYISEYDKFMQRTRGKDSFLFSRAGFTGIQQHPGHWAGDEDSSWRAFRTNLYAMFSMSISGEPFVGWDIAGFGGEIPTPELYLRASAMSVFCPIMQYHSEYARLEQSRDRTPWNIQERSGDPNVIAEFRDLVNLRMNLLPTIQHEAWQSVQTGLPMMRPLALEYPADASARRYSFEYLFGGSLLVAPVTEEGKRSTEVYLPAGTWRDFWTKQSVEGGRTFSVETPRNRVPVYQREGSILAFHTNEKFELFSDVGNETENYQQLALRVFPGDGCSLDLVKGQGNSVQTVTIKPAQTGWALELPALNVPIEVEIFIDEPKQVTCNGHAVEWQWDTAVRSVKFQLAAVAGKQAIQIL